MKKWIVNNCKSILKPNQFKYVAVKLIILFGLNIYSTATSANEYVALSESFLENLVQEKESEAIVKAYADLSFEDLVNGLATREEQLTFWINTYNAFVIYILQNDPSKYDDRGAFFSKGQINIAGQNFSFDNIEHDIIRNSRVKWSLGYLKKWFVSKEIRQLRIKKREPLVHFALNCGAQSCPAVDIYNEETLTEQLNRNSKAYLSTVTDVNGDKIETTPLFSWFRGDFGGKKGIKKLLLSFGLIQQTDDMELNFKGYDWTIDIDNYVPGLK